MAKGRRAADRRREREQARGHGVDPKEETHQSIDADERRAARAETALHSEAEPHEGIGIGDDLTDDTNRLGDVADVTAIKDRPEADPRPGGMLHILEGENADKRYLLRVTPFVFGRASWVDHRVEDPTVSREHFMLTFVPEDEVWRAEDLESTSGTLLNGLPLTMITEVKHGDVIAAGQMVMRFLHARELPEAKEEEEEEEIRERTRTGLRPPPKDKTRTQVMPKKKEKKRREGPSRLPLVAGVLLALLIVAGGAGAAVWYAYFHGVEDKGQVSAQVTALTDEAERLMQQGDLEEAKLRLETALALVPGHPLAESLLKLVTSDLEAERALDEAARLFDEGKVEEALKVLGRVPDSSRFAERRDDLRGRAGEIARKASSRAIESLIDEGRLEEAEAMLKTHLERWPRDAFAQGMKTRIQSIRDAPPPEDPTLARARDAFQKGDVLQARILIEPAAARGSRVAERYLADLDRFDAAVARGKQKVARKDKSALKDLDAAWRLLSRLGRNDKGGVAVRLKKPLADALFLTAVSARSAGRACDWARYVLRARKLAPRDRKLAAQARAVEQKAKAALLRAEARAASDRQQARQIAREGQCFAAPGSRTAKALRQIGR